MTPIARAIQQVLASLTKDWERPGLKDTPERVDRYFHDMTTGYGVQTQQLLKVFEDGAEQYDEMVFEGGITFYSMCEHHLVPFFGVAHVAYIPNGKIVGLSKIPRLVEAFARRLQVQERMTKEIATTLQDHLQPKGVGVVLKARHLCMESRGVRKPGTITYTSKLLGVMREGGARDEFLKFVDMADRRTEHL